MWGKCVENPPSIWGFCKISRNGKKRKVFCPAPSPHFFPFLSFSYFSCSCFRNINFTFFLQFSTLVHTYSRYRYCILKTFVMHFFVFQQVFLSNNFSTIFFLRFLLVFISFLFSTVSTFFSIQYTFLFHFFCYHGIQSQLLIFTVFICCFSLLDF